MHNEMAKLEYPMMKFCELNDVYIMPHDKLIVYNAVYRDVNVFIIDDSVLRGQTFRN